MLPKKNRLKDKKEFNATFRFGKTVCSKEICAKIRPTQADATKIGVAAGTKLFKKAAHRSRAKRILREAAKKNIEKIAKPHNIVLFFQKRPQKMSTKSATEQTTEIFKKAHVI